MVTERQLRDELVATARKYLGQRETHGSNRSPFIDMLAKLMGIPLGTAWCAMFVSYIIKEVCDKHGLKRPFKLTASSQSCFTQVPAKFRHQGPAKKGDLGTQTQKKNKALGHVYMVAADQTDKKLHKTIEGNTNKAGSREGDGVYENTRSTDDTSSKTFRGFSDVVAWICEANGIPLGGDQPAPHEEPVKPISSWPLPGESSERVKQMQLRLDELGFGPLKGTGFFGSTTQECVARYQKAIGLNGSGVPGPQTMAALEKGIKPVTDPTVPGLKLRWDGEHADASKWTEAVVAMLKNSKLLTVQLKDAESVGYPASPENRVKFYAHLLAKMAEYESSFNPMASYRESFKDASGKNVISRGLLQLSIESCNGYGAGLRDAEQLHDPKTNLWCAILILEKWLPQDGVLFGKSALGKWLGAGRYWAVCRSASSKQAQIIKHLRGIQY